MKIKQLEAEQLKSSIAVEYNENRPCKKTATCNLSYKNLWMWLRIATYPYKNAG